jgi:hypothetical protein
MRIYNLQGLGAPVRTKKKKYAAEMIFISCYNFLRVERDQPLLNLKKTHPTVHPQHKIYGNSHRSAVPQLNLLEIVKSWHLFDERQFLQSQFLLPECLDHFGSLSSSIVIIVAVINVGSFLVIHLKQYGKFAN